MSYQSERQLEILLLKQLREQQNYTQVNINNESELLNNFRKQLNIQNSINLKGINLSDKEFQRVMNHIGGKSIFSSAKILRDKFLLERDDGEEAYLEFINFDEIDKNVFQVTNQVTMVGSYTNRYDVTILINGLPIIQIELKRRGMDIKQAFNQIERYRKHSYSGLFKYVQLFVISNGVDTKYFANSDRKLIYSATFYWTDELNSRITTLQQFASVFLDKSHVLKMISKYTVINDTDKVVMVLKPYQVYAVESIYKRATETNENGFIWHTTGAGKTLTSWLVSNLLKNHPDIKKVFFLVDRKDLDSQTVSEFNKFEKGSVDTTDKTSVLVKQIENKNVPLIVTTIQKMSKAIKSPRYSEIMKTYENDKVIFIIDECHRTQFGEMHKEVKRFFKNAQYFGFTGTPRFKENMSQDGRTTADVFGKCLHTYLIKEAINDHNVLGFSVEYVKTFKGQYDETDATLVEEIDTKEIYDSVERLELITEHITKHHHLKTLNGQYTSIFAVSSIPVLIKYYNLFKSQNAGLKVSAIFTFGANEDSEGSDSHSRDSLEGIISDYNVEYGTNYTTDTFSAYHTDISKRLKSAQIDILIVVNMFLTGFDSKPLNTLYVDKNLKYHELVQAFSRTNRVEQVTKPHGNVVCYRNLKAETDEALRLFSQSENVDDILMKDYEYYLKLFNEAVSTLKVTAPTPSSLDEVMEEEKKKCFVESFKELSRILLTLQTFVDFEFDDEQLGISEQEYQDYKSKYFNVYEDVSRNYANKVSVLNDIDFSIELIQVDKINVSYIMNLIKSIDLSNKESIPKEIERIKKELDRSGSAELRKKVDLLKRFLDDVVPSLTSDDSVDDSYGKYEDEARANEIEVFAKENDIDAIKIRNEISEYEFSGIVDTKRLTDLFLKSVSFLEKVSKTKKIKDFIINHVDKFQ